MKRNYYLLPLVVLLCVMAAFPARAQLTTAPQREAAGQRPAAMGTFQLIRTNKLEEALQTDALVVIEAMRNDSVVVYHAFSQNLLVRILPKREIESPDFRPLQHLYLDDDRGKEDGR